MNRSSGIFRATVAAGMLLIVPAVTFAQHYVQKNLVSDISQPANADGSTVTVDPNLKNAWGLARGASSPWWLNNAGTGTSTLYRGAGATVALVVTIPNAKGAQGPSAPTGMVFNGSTDFAFATNNPADFIFATKTAPSQVGVPPQHPSAQPANPPPSPKSTNPRLARFLPGSRGWR